MSSCPACGGHDHRSPSGRLCPVEVTASGTRLVHQCPWCDDPACERSCPEGRRRASSPLRPAMFYEADRARFQEAIEQAIWDWMVDHGTDRKAIVRTVDAAIENVEHQMGVAS